MGLLFLPAALRNITICAICFHYIVAAIPALTMDSTALTVIVAGMIRHAMTTSSVKTGDHREGRSESASPDHDAGCAAIVL